MVFDSSEKKPEVHWTKQHQDQGFARRELSVHFSTLEQEGKANVKVFYRRSCDPSQGTRIIAVPLNVPSGELNIQGLEEWPIDRFLTIDPGSYVVTLSQRIDHATDRLILDFFIDPAETQRSQIIKGDELLRIPNVLLETADPVRL